MKLKIIFFIFILFYTNFLFAKDKINILILHSYHPTFKWTEDINKGIYSVLKNDSYKYEFFVEYMDTKRFVNKLYYEKLFNIYKQKYQNTKFNVIISSDNNAVDFLKKYKDEAFFHSKIVFCGVNYIKKDDFKDYKNFTGVNEQVNIKRNIDLILKLHPKVKNIYAIIDDTKTGKIIKNQFNMTIKQYKNHNINFEILSKLSLNELKDKIRKIPNNSVILQSIYLRAKNTFLEFYEVPKMISENSSAPLYGLWDFNINNGIIGGFLTSGYYQGRNAALMAQKILNGEKVKNIPILYNSPNQYIFDYEQILKYKINEELLPKTSHIINKPKSFFLSYKKEILFLFAVFILLISLIIILLINIKKRKKAEKNIQRQLVFQQDLIDNVHAPIYYKDITGKYIGCNKSFEKFVNKNKDDILGKTAYDLVEKEIADIYHNNDLKVLRKKEPIKYESIFKENNKLKNLIFYKNLYYKQDGSVLGIIGVIFDITKLKKTTKKLNKLNKTLEKKVDIRTYELKQINEELEISNKQLQDTIEDLKKTQEQLIISEKLAGLASLVAGIAHEINTPVGIGVTAITHFLELHKKIQLEYKNDKMTQENFEDFLDSTQILAKSIDINLQRTANLVKSFKAISSDQASENKRVFNIKSYLNEILLSIINITKKTQLKIDIVCDENLQVESYPGDLSQIITNLIINSINHGYKDKIKKGNIQIIIKKHEDKIQIVYKDDGLGIDEKHLDKIFEPFFTTNRKNGGTGLGLNVVYNIVTGKLKGDISCTSQINKGVEFTINFHVNFS